MLTPFAIATLAPVGLILAGAAWGGGWAWGALGYMAVLVALLDRLTARALPAAPDQEFPLAARLCTLLGLAHFAVLAAVIASFGALGTGAGLALLLATGLFLGQVSNANAHELIHRRDRAGRWLGIAVYASMFFGHHASAHPLVHHRWVGTERDPATAHRGETFPAFARRAWIGSFRLGLEAERTRLTRIGRSRWSNPYLAYLALSLATLAGALALGGVAGGLVLLLLALLAQGQLLLTDYVQHYGLTRAMGADGKPEPVGPQHSWNSPHPASSALLLNGPRHSDHHMRPARAFPALTLPREAPTLPRGLPAMAFLALWPRMWRKVMHPRLDALSLE